MCRASVVTSLFTLDTACVIAMVKTESNHPPGEVDAIARLIDLAREGCIELQLAVAYDRDFDRFKTPEGRVRQLDWMHSDSATRLGAHQPALTRMPMPEHLPVIVATRMSLSFPLLISAVPMWTIDRRTDKFVKVWFTDGGLCNNFPVQLFDSALPTRATFAINLGRFSNDPDETTIESDNLRYATTNRSGIAPRVAAIPHSGLKAVTGFAGQAFNSARNWSDVPQLDQPGYRDRIVEVLQTAAQGGMNFDMQGATIDRLANRGAAAAAVMAKPFNQPKYRTKFTGWDNHRWIRYRATLASLPDWLASFKRGATVLAIEPDDTPGIDISLAAAELAKQITDRLTDLADVIATAEPEVVDSLMGDPRPRTVLHRVPQL